MKTIRTRIKEIAFATLYPLFRLLPLKSGYILFNCDNGKRFSDNPLALYTELKNNSRDYQYIITLNNNQFEKNTCIPYMSIRYLYYLATSKYLVSNVNMYSGLRVRKNQVYLETWHGTPLKRIGDDIIDDERKKEKQEWLLDASHWTYFLSNAPISNQDYESAFHINPNIILDYGLPRNDNLTSDTQLYNAFRSKRNIIDRKVILYAPTFRDNGTTVNFNFKKFAEQLGDEYYLLINFHRLYEVHTIENISNVEFNDKLTIEDCMKVADILVTDYSSVMFDYALLERPMVFYPYDFDYYSKEDRGFYFDYTQTVPGPIFYDQDKMMSFFKSVQSGDFNIARVKQFAKQFNANAEQRNASERVIRRVFD
ncbi:CDP-glycerol glycerophosphotransferase family protein [Levilactobacillus bambusae]|uniref:CDP-glycerol--glycerophosphate glycerophosphotransferase n=1 Tax=Levilactobacillus bambusae TaxID=2024736 RepID=A0A2V1MZ74_9LACO|nr:CDP-glycerol glycerophosphotransferase family protein [Levilactobacillus bambusae]PWF99787.1 CDP-glycerol--glycerophosphate glycerophosphotransferase [Levilactobacillus bambusae]